MIDVCIIGAGPGGSMAAIQLAKSGVSVVMLEKEKFPRDKICGDALSGKVVELLKRAEPSLLDEITASTSHLPSWGVTFVAPNVKALRVPFKSNYNTDSAEAPGFIARRTNFDHLLASKAASYPRIELKEEVNASKFQKTETGWKIFNKQGREILTCRLIIDASGAQSPFSRHIAGLKTEKKHHCAGLRQYFNGVEGMDAENFIELHFLKEFLPGYFWIFPLPDGRANVGVGMRSDVVSAKKVNLKDKMQEIIGDYPELKSRFKNAIAEGPVKGFGLPLGSMKRKISGEGYMLTGDAAALIDPFTGEGIGNAMYSGYFAAIRAVEALRAENFSAGFLKEYDKRVYNRLWDELKLSRRMQSLVKFPWLFNLVVNKASGNPALADLISCMFEDIELRNKLRSPSFYFNLLFAKSKA